MKVKTGISLLFLLLFSLGFRVYSGHQRWTITPTDPDIWIRMCERPNFTEDNLPANDPLKGGSLAFSNVLLSIRTDYKNVGTTFIRLKDSAVDAGFNANTSRIIDVCFTGLVGASGLTNQLTQNETVTGCQVRLDPNLKGNVSRFVAVLTHELGHCMGLDHPQELTHAIMSYFSDPNIVRLQTDDKMGLTYLYPTDPAYGDEKPTYGMSCSE